MSTTRSCGCCGSHIAQDDQQEVRKAVPLMDLIHHHLRCWHIMSAHPSAWGSRQQPAQVRTAFCWVIRRTSAWLTLLRAYLINTCAQDPVVIHDLLSTSMHAEF